MISKRETDILRGWSLIIIAMSHIIDTPFMQSGILRIILPSNVAIFFFSTGYGLCLSYNKKGDDYLNGFILDKVFRKLFLPYFFIRIIFSGIVDYCADGIIPSVRDLIGSHAWYAEFTIIVYICFYLIFKYIKDNRARGIIAVICLIIYTGMCALVKAPSTWYQGVFALILGSIIAYYEEFIVEICKRYLVLCLCVSIILMYFFDILTFGLVNIPLAGTMGALGTPLFTATSLVLVMRVIKEVPSFIDGTINRVLLFIGTNSYLVYLFHSIIAGILWHFIRNAWINFLLTIVITCIIIMGINRILQSFKRKKA